MGLFKTWMLTQTAGISNACKNDPEFAEFVTKCFERHISGDWGDDTCEDDAVLNDEVVEADRNGKLSVEIMSSFKIDEERSVWIITE